MIKNKTIWRNIRSVVVIIFIILTFGLIATLNSHITFLQKENTALEQTVQNNKESLVVLSDWIVEDGQNEAKKWFNEIENYKKTLSNLVEQTSNANYFTQISPEQLDRISAIEQEAKISRSLPVLKNLLEEYVSICGIAAVKQEELENSQQNVEDNFNSVYIAEYVESDYSIQYVEENIPVSTPISSISEDFINRGVIYKNGNKYTYYSSNEGDGDFAYSDAEGMTVDENGMYKDNEGYIIVAANKNDYSGGDVVETPFGQGKVYDTGCNTGTIDIYTNY